MVEYKDRLLEAMKDAGFSTSTLAKALGLSYQAVRKVLMGSSLFNTDNHDRAAMLLGVSSSWLASGRGEKRPASVNKYQGVAHDLSLADAIMDPPMLTWSDLMSAVQIPPRFQLSIRDDAMAPEIPAGTTVIFSTAEGEPRPRDAVLARDKEGNVYFREYRFKRPGHWQAAAINSGYEPLDSQADGLTVLAVMVGRLGRRSA